MGMVRMRAARRSLEEHSFSVYCSARCRVINGLAIDGGPSAAEVERIAAHPRPDVRNLQITGAITNYRL